MVDAAAAGTVVVVAAIVLVLIGLLAASAKRIQPYEVGVVLAFGSYRGNIGPGLHFVHPMYRVIPVDLRPRTATLPRFATPLSDGTTIQVAARAEYHVVKAQNAVFATRDLSASMVEAMRDAVSGAVSGARASGLPSSGFALSEEARARLSGQVSNLGVELGQFALRLPGPLGMAEYLAGQRIPPGPALPTGPG
jgi:regulator of protease activity HflC (stomatin/prohibitin superfamily)